MIDEKKVSTSIIENYDHRLGFMRSKYQYHYALRRWRVEAQRKYIIPILNDFQMRCLFSYPLLLGLKQKDFIRKESYRMLARQSSKSERKVKRKKVYEERPEILFYSDLIFYLFLTKVYRLEGLPVLAENFQAGLTHLKQVDLEELFLFDDLVEVNPSAVANHLYFAKLLKVTDLEEKLLEKYQDFWLTFKPKTKLDWRNKIYGLAHLIIAASGYYQKFVNDKKFGWILRFFEENIDQIIKETNVDMVAEIGLCFRLCQKNESLVLAKCKKLVMSCFDEEKGIIVKEKSPKVDFGKLEHRNTMALLLLADYERFNLGPNLGIFMRERRQKLFLPEKGSFVS